MKRNLVIYSVLPLLSFVIYYYCKITFNSILLTYLLIILNGFNIAYLANLNINKDNKYLIISSIYILVILLAYFYHSFNLSISILEPLINILTWSQDIILMYLGCFIYNIIKPKNGC